MRPATKRTAVTSKVKAGAESALFCSVKVVRGVEENVVARIHLHHEVVLALTTEAEPGWVAAVLVALGSRR